MTPRPIKQRSKGFTSAEPLGSLRDYRKPDGPNLLVAGLGRMSPRLYVTRWTWYCDATLICQMQRMLAIVTGPLHRGLKLLFSHR